MNKIKTVLDREPISSEFIQSKQDFGKVLHGAKISSAGFWKTSWFYGVVGTASIVLTVTVISIDSTSKANPLTDRIAQASVVPQEMVNKPVINAAAIKDAPVENVKTEVTPVRQTVSKETSVVSDNQQVTESSRVQQPLSEEKTVKPHKYTGMMPHFGNVFVGDITVDELCGGNGLLCNDEWGVTSFTVQYYNEFNKSIEQHIKGNRIPYGFCEMFPKSGTFTVFVTDIRAEHRSTGQITMLQSMNLEATR